MEEIDWTRQTGHVFFFRVFTALGVARRDRRGKGDVATGEFLSCVAELQPRLAFDQYLDLAILPVGILRKLYNFGKDNSG